MAITYTTNLNLAKPAHGDVDWHTPLNENFDKIDEEITEAKTITGTTIDADKDWNGKNITNLGKISPKACISIASDPPLLISKSGDSPVIVTFSQQVEGTGYVKVMVTSGGYDYSVPSSRTFKLFKNGVEIWSDVQGYYWNGDWYEMPAYSRVAMERLEIAGGNIITLTCTDSRNGSLTCNLYAFVSLAPHGIVS